MITMQHRKNKRGLQQLSDVQKMEAITKVQKGETKAAVAREFGVPESTLRGWCKKAKLNGHCQSVMNKSLQVTSTMSPVLMPAEMAYRDCGYSKGSGSDEGSTIHPFSDEPEDEDIKPSAVIPEEQRRVLDWLNYGHYSQLAGQTPSTNDNKPAQPVVTSSTCDDVVKPTSKSSKPCKPNNDHCNRAQMLPVFSKNVSFYNWCKTNTSTVCDGYSSPVSPVSPASSDKIDSYEDEPLALVVPSKRRLSDLETCFKNELNKMYHDRPVIINNTIHNNINNNDNSTVNNNNNNDNNNCSSKNNNFIVTPYNIENGLCNGDKVNNHHHRVAINHNSSDNGMISKGNYCNDGVITDDRNDNTKQTLSVEEALKHGEVFLDWLKACSDPNVTVFQAMQIGTLLKNLRSSLERSQNRR